MENSKNVTVDGKSLNEWVDKEVSREISSNYKNEIGVLSKKSHKPIITRGGQKYNYRKAGEVKKYTMEEILNKYGELIHPHDSLIKNIFEVVKAKKEVEIVEIARILKKANGSIRSRISVIKKITGNRIITKDGQIISMTEKNMSVDEAFNIYKRPKRRKKNKNKVKRIKNRYINKPSKKEYIPAKSNNESSDLSININISGTIFIKFGVIRSGE